MPFVRISLSKEHSQETKTCISHAVHLSLMDEFKIPKDDYFHVIEELDRNQIKYPETYLGISHTADIVYIQIIAGTGRSSDQKRRLYQAIAEKISSTTPVTKNNIIIILLENNGMENWSFGNGECQTPAHLQTNI